MPAIQEVEVSVDQSLSVRMQTLIALFRAKYPTSPNLVVEIGDFLRALDLLVGELPKQKQLELFGQLSMGFGEAE